MVLIYQVLARQCLEKVFLTSNDFVPNDSSLLKTMLASCFVYKLSLLPTPPKSVLQELDVLYYDFLWEGHGHRIKKQTMELDIEHGGFRMLNVYIQEFSLKFVWLKRLIDGDSIFFWQHQLCNCFKLPIDVILRLNIVKTRIKSLIQDNHTLPVF